MADGVGGWRQYGIDPGDFSTFLMNTCSRIVQSSPNYNPELPVNLLSASYKELLENKKPILGESSLNFGPFCDAFVDRYQTCLVHTHKKYAKSHDKLFVSFTGSSTACILILNRENNTISTANIGDSGYLVVRNGQVVQQSEEQTHYFNTPFQLSTPYINNVLRDQPESAQQQTFSVVDGDVILVATDGVFDNVPVSLLVDTLKQVRELIFL